MITVAQEQSIRTTLAAMPTLAVGLGTQDQACSIAALNLGLTGTLTDRVPDCMSEVIGRWIIGIQDRMPTTIRDSAAWRELLVLSAGTGREHEAERLASVLDWMWSALAVAQPQADQLEYGDAWATMMRERTSIAAQDAVTVAVAAADVVTAAAAFAVATAAADAFADADADVVADVVAGVRSFTSSAAYADAWDTIDPAGLLRRMVAVTDERALVVPA